jgi:S-adenosylmethionine decarboxylase
MEFFEGTEKLLEIWFKKPESSSSSNTNDLRDIPRETIDYILSLVNCKCLSFIRTKDIDSYVLSESSLFINKQRILIKTCGTTTLLLCVKPFIEAANNFCGLAVIEDVFYSRKRFMRPELQKSPHNSFEQEVGFLHEMFGGGTDYALGNVENNWYLYTLNKHVSIKEPDQTLEIIMTKLDRDVMKIFTQEFSASTDEATKQSKIDTIFPNAILDSYLFEPCGYSVNAILPKGHYFTIHITPEEDYSYVSFETDAPESDYPALIKRVLKIFNPEQFMLTFFANETSVGTTFNKKHYNFEKFSYDALQEKRIKNYNLTYAHYTKRLI